MKRLKESLVTHYHPAHTKINSSPPKEKETEVEERGGTLARRLAKGWLEEAGE